MSHKKTKTAIRKLKEQQGWNDITMEVLASEFIAENKLSAKFLEFLQHVAEEENSCEE